jgi:hypothetical protein
VYGEGVERRQWGDTSARRCGLAGCGPAMDGSCDVVVVSGKF